RFDDQRVIELVGDGLPCVVIGEGFHRLHGRSRSASRSPSLSDGLLETRRGSSGPHTGRKSHQGQARSPGGGGRKPSSMARSMISSASRPTRRLPSLIGISWSTKPPAEVQSNKRQECTGACSACSIARL